MGNFFDGATGWQTIDVSTGHVVGGGTFSTVPSVLPTAGGSHAVSIDWAKGYGIDAGILDAYGVGGNVVKSGGGAGGSGLASVVSASAGAPYSTPDQGGTASEGGIYETVADYFLRAVIIILGFIFVAVGLNMFKPGLVQVPVSAVRVTP